MSARLGMYVHQHWAYRRPYAARTWSFTDWNAYAGGLAALGYDSVMIWPVLETIPDPPTASDLAHLDKLRHVIDMLHVEYGMKVLITLGANTVGNKHASEYPFEERPFFRCDERLDPGDPKAMERLMHVRRALLQPLAGADGFVIIDSDPGGWAGSTNEEFVAILQQHRNLLDELNPAATITYWLWVGWASYNRFWERVESTGDTHIDVDPNDWVDVISALPLRDDERWRFFVCSDEHRKLAARLGIDGRSTYFPYGLVEGEPTFPLTNLSEEAITSHLDGFPWGCAYRGCMANAQTHVVQLPNTYLFAHVACGGTLDSVDLSGFADQLAPGVAELVTAAWTTLANPSTDRAIAESARALAQRIESARSRVRLPTDGPLVGLVMNDPDRFLGDLVHQLRFVADIADAVRSIVDGGNIAHNLCALIESWGAWSARTGFVDAYLGPVMDRLHPALTKLDDTRINAVLSDFDNWREPSVRNGIVPRLIESIVSYAAR